MPPILSRLRALLTGSDHAGPADASGEEAREQRHLAAAALLVEAAREDGDYAPGERALIPALLARRFSLSAAEAEALVRRAETAQAGATDLFRFTREAVAGMDERERETLVEMMWRIVLADGIVDDFEASLMRRVAGLLYVSDRASGLARARAMNEMTEARDGG